MTQDEIIEMARQSGLHVATDVNWMPVIGLAYAKKLVEMATQHERETCAKLCESESSNVAEHMFGKECAAAIRARGQA